MTITIYNNKNKKVYTSHHIDCKCFSVKSVLILSSFLHMLAHAKGSSDFHLYLNIYFQAASSN